MKAALFGLAGSILAGLSTIPFATANAADAEPYIVGIAGAATGAAAGTQAPVVELLRIYFDRVNAKGGINGHPVKLYIEDDQGEASRAASNVVKLTREDHVQLLIETSLSLTFGPVIAEANRANVPLLFAGSVCTQDVHPPAKRLEFCSTSFDAALDLPLAVETMHAASKEKVSFAYMGLATPIARVSAEAAGKKATELGMAMVDQEFIAPTATDFMPFATKAAAANPNWVLAYAPWLTQAKSFEALRRLGWNGNFIASGLLPAEDDLTRIKDPSFQVVSANAMFGDDLPVQKEIRDVVTSGKYSYPVTYAGEGWLSGMTIEAILAKTSFPVTTDKLLASMNTLDLDTKGLRGGNMKWTEQNHFRTEGYYRLYHWDNAKQSVFKAGEWLKVDVNN